MYERSLWLQVPVPTNVWPTVISITNSGNYLHVRQRLVSKKIPKIETQEFNKIMFGFAYGMDHVAMHLSNY